MVAQKRTTLELIELMINSKANLTSRSVCDLFLQSHDIHFSTPAAFVVFQRKMGDLLYFSAINNSRTFQSRHTCSQRRTTPPCWSTWFYNLLIRKSNASHWGSVCSKQSRSKCKRIGSCRKECASVIWCRISFLYDRIKSMPTNTRLSGMSGLSLCSPYTNQKWKPVEIARAIWTKIATDNGPRSARLGTWCTANIWGRAHTYSEPSSYSQWERDSAINAN